MTEVYIHVIFPQNNETANGRAACASNPVGLFMFLAPTFPENNDQTRNVDSLFARNLHYQ